MHETSAVCLFQLFKAYKRMCAIFKISTLDQDYNIAWMGFWIHQVQDNELNKDNTVVWMGLCRRLGLPSTRHERYERTDKMCDWL